MNTKEQTDSIFLDFSNAFDSFAYCRFITKLTALLIGFFTLPWLSNFVSNRQQFTVVNDIASSPTYVTSGVNRAAFWGHYPFAIEYFPLNIPLVYGFWPTTALFIGQITVLLLTKLFKMIPV